LLPTAKVRPNRLQRHRPKDGFGWFIGGLFAYGKRGTAPLGETMPRFFADPPGPTPGTSSGTPVITQKVQLPPPGDGLGAVGGPELAVEVV
jgi:hypothetical protein